MNSKHVGSTDYRKMIPGFKQTNADEISDEQLKILDRTFMLGKLCTAIVHELRQPLAAILSNAQTARSILEKNSVNLAEIRDIVDDIIADDKRATEVMHRLQGFFSHGMSRYETFDFNELVTDTLKIIQSHLKIHHVKLSQDLDPLLLQVQADRVQFQQVLLNLFLNAIEAMSGTARHERELSVRSENRKNDICLLVSDTGSGIAANAMDCIFDPFFTTKDEGMGIGLFISLSIVSEHGGDIKAFNNSDRGAVFSLILPTSPRYLHS